MVKFKGKVGGNKSRAGKMGKVQSDATIGPGLRNTGLQLVRKQNKNMPC